MKFRPFIFLQHALCYSETSLSTHFPHGGKYAYAVVQWNIRFIFYSPQPLRSLWKTISSIFPLNLRRKRKREKKSSSPGVSLHMMERSKSSNKKVLLWNFPSQRAVRFTCYGILRISRPQEEKRLTNEDLARGLPNALYRVEIFQLRFKYFYWGFVQHVKLNEITTGKTSYN